MNRNEFIKRMNDMEPTGVNLSDEERDDIIKKGINIDGTLEKMVVIMEEMAELQQQVSKQFRGCGDRVCLLEETADVYISLMLIKEIFYFSDEEIEDAIDVKMVREKERIAKYLHKHPYKFNSQK